MSQYYEMSVEIRGYNPLCVPAIKEAANDEWAFDDWYEANACLTAHGRSNLCGGEGEDEFARRLSREIWKANNGYCEVTVHAMYLEEAPFETYIEGEEEFEEWKASGGLSETGK